MSFKKKSSQVSFFSLKTTPFPEKKKKGICNERTITVKRISTTSLFLQLYKMKLVTAGEMALMVTDRIKSKQILRSLIIDAIEKCRIEFNYL